MSSIAESGFIKNNDAGDKSSRRFIKKLRAPNLILGALILQFGASTSRPLSAYLSEQRKKDVPVLPVWLKTRKLHALRTRFAGGDEPLPTHNG